MNFKELSDSFFLENVPGDLKSNQIFLQAENPELRVEPNIVEVHADTTHFGIGGQDSQGNISYNITAYKEGDLETKTLVLDIQEGCEFTFEQLAIEDGDMSKVNWSSRPILAKTLIRGVSLPKFDVNFSSEFELGVPTSTPTEVFIPMAMRY